MVPRTEREIEQCRSLIEDAQAEYEAEAPCRCWGVELEAVREVGAVARVALAGSQLLDRDSVAFVARPRCRCSATAGIGAGSEIRGPRGIIEVGREAQPGGRQI
jgi:hypothetical protein